ncbi:uncharacterized protein [Spinacia oleracea]|uniref:Helitron helicase-like domain-containing protein n=1 Tax=Spinacia oleracea TaxID=3562 RepID=A0ABM3RHU4_SPIOL|nr:uncharacterized protein LOC130469748 [Spinacia oleracea]
MIYVVEYQKWGLPHAHFLVILKPNSKIRCPADFDKFVSAEIPSLASPHLRKIVLQHMMHGPCAQLNPDCACMKRRGNEGHCKYGYPKKFADKTTNSSDGESVCIRRVNMDNRSVIPYNLYLSSLFDCHLNVEVCSTIMAVKYLYKYVYKGHDRISFNVVQDGSTAIVDEIQEYQAGRWVSPCEAAWRIFGFDLLEMSPSVLPLQIHLTNLQTIQVIPHENLDEIISNDKRSRTQLT